MNALQQLIADFKQDNPEETYTSIAQRGSTPEHPLPRSTVHSLATKESFRQTPQLPTLEALALGMNMPLVAVTQAASAAAFGYHGTVMSDIEDENIRTVVIGMSEIDAKRRAELAARVRFLVAEYRAESGRDGDPGK